MSNKLRLYPYGFIFTDNYNLNIPDYYKKNILANGFIYCHDESIKPALYQCDDNFVLIHGHFTHVGEREAISNNDLPEKLFSLHQERKEDFLDVLDFIGGRYIIIIGCKESISVYPDATACRSLYYSTDCNTISSHVDLLAINIDSKKDYLIKDSTRLSYSLNLTPYTNIKSILPNICLNLLTKKTERFFPRRKNIYQNLTTEIRFNLVERLWKKQLEYYSKEYEYLIFSLTAGQDSRASLALAKDYIDKLSFFTYTVIPEKNKEKSYFTESLSIDEIVVKQIIKDIPLKHQFFYFKRFENVLTEDEQKVFSRNSLLSHGRYLIKYYNDAYPQNNVMHLRATSLEIGRAVYMPTDKPNDIGYLRSFFIKQMRTEKNKISNEKLLNIFNQAIENFHYEKMYNYHLLDMYYWENRLGRWFPEVLNETDSAFDTFLPYNMRAIIDISLSFDIDMRRSNFMFKEIINRNYPILNFYGKNEVKNIYEKIRDSDINTKSYTEFFTVYDISTKKYIKIINNNYIYIPKKYLNSGSYSETFFTFKDKSGMAKLTILNEYYSAKGSGYICYEVYKNSEILLTEDISKINFEIDIFVYNLVEGDRVCIRVKALKNCKLESWEKASILKIISYKEVMTDFQHKNKIISTSPFSKTY